MECGSRKLAKGVGLQGLSVDEMKELLTKADIQHSKREKREYYCKLLIQALKQGRLILDRGKFVVVPQGKNSANKSPKRGSPSVKPPKKESPVKPAIGSKEKQKEKESPVKPAIGSKEKQKEKESPVKLAIGSKEKQKEKKSKSPTIKREKLKKDEIQQIIGGLGRNYKSEATALMKTTGFKFDSVLGKGTYGKVFKVSDSSGKFYAIKRTKINSSALVYDDNKAVTEAYYTSLFRHPNIVRSLDFSVSNKKSYMIMNWATSVLDDKIKSGLKVEEKLRIIYKIGSAVLYLNSNGYVHCDIKPNNVLMYGDEPVLSDLGLIHDLWNEPKIKRRQDNCQTSCYRAPEKYHHNKESIRGYIRKYPLADDVWYKTDSLQSKSEFWSFGILCMDIILNRPYFTCQKGKRGYGREYYTELLDDMVATSPEIVFRNVLNERGLSPLSASEEKLFVAVMKHLLRFEIDERDMTNFLNDNVFDSFREEPVPPIQPYRVEIINTKFNAEGVIEIIAWLHSNYYKVIPLVVVSDAMDLFIQRAYLFQLKEYKEAVVACIMFSALIHNIEKPTIYYTKPLNEPNAYKGVYKALNKILNRWPIHFERLYAQFDTFSLRETAYLDIVTTESINEYIKNPPSAIFNKV